MKKPSKAKAAPDPIRAAISERQRLEKIWCVLGRDLDLAEYRASKKLGSRPHGSARAEKAWDRRAGITAKRRKYERAIEAEERATARLAKTKPTTLASAAVMLAYLKKDVDAGDMDWHDTAFATLIGTLKAWGQLAQLAPR